MEFVIYAIAVVLSCLALWVGVRDGRRLGRVTGISVAIVALVSASLWRPHRDTLKPLVPAISRDQGFISSDNCRSCHPQQYDSWHASYHRTMTQKATPTAVLGDFSNRTLHDQGRSYRLCQEGDHFFVDMIDPAWHAQLGIFYRRGPQTKPPRMRTQVVMTTGSHHLQAYWLRRNSEDGFLYQMPWVYHIAEERWIPTADSFLAPPRTPDDSVKVITWNGSCVYCHSVAGRPHVNPWQAATQTAELGIACEACHGPAEEHVRVNHDPRRRYVYYLGDEPDPTIVNPAQLSHERSTQVCGQCHSVHSTKNIAEFLQTGYRYAAGDDLHRHRLILRYTENPQNPQIKKWLRKHKNAQYNRFWKDGTVRITGREYNGLLESPCYLRGKMSCLSCHSMHQSDPNDQLSAHGKGNAACLECHVDFRTQISQHTHHPEDSAGSECMNCHMPHTTWGLFTAIRSHRIDSPRTSTSLETGRPNACNQCHVDQTLSWTATHLSDWYGQEPVELSDEQSRVSSSVLWLLRGDAIQRAIASWTMGWDQAQEISGHNWQAPLLAFLLKDPYSAVRFSAYKALKKLPGFESFNYNFLASPEQRLKDVERAIELWKQQEPPPIDQAKAGRVLQNASGKLRRNEVESLVEKRNNRRVSIKE